MNSLSILFLLASSAVIYAIIAGVFLAFSDFIMKSLPAIDPFSGARSMQEINRRVYGSFFLILLMGMSALSVAIILIAYFALSGPVAIWVISGAACYFVFVFLVTVLCNVPMNERLDAMDPSRSETESYWKTYSISWTHWNHLRTIASAVSSVCLLIGCLMLI